MKLYERIDGLFATKKQRHAWLGIWFSAGLLWQMVWLMLVYGRLAALDGYESLFEIFGNLKIYEYAWLIRAANLMISVTSINPGTILGIIIQSTHSSEIVIFLAGLLYTIGEHSKKRVFWLWALLASLVIILGAAIGIGMGASSLNQVIAILKIGSACSLVICLLATGISFDILFRSVFTVLERQASCQKSVHES